MKFKGDEDITHFQKVTLRVFLTIGLILLFLGFLSLVNIYLHIGIKVTLLTHYSINNILICMLVITGIIFLGTVIKIKFIRVLLNILIIASLILFLINSIIERIDNQYTEFFSENGKVRYLAEENYRGSKIYQVKWGIFLLYKEEIDVGDHWFPFKREKDQYLNQ